MKDINSKIPGLTLLSNAYNSLTGCKSTPIDIAYIIRQLHIATGCFHQCTHCFADAPKQTTQMDFTSFYRFTKELALVSKYTNTPYRVLFFGAASDPSSIKDFYKYLDAWIDLMPKSQPVKIFSHGWNLSNELQRKEFINLLEVYSNRKKHTITHAISIDAYSIIARKNWKYYIDNIAQNLKLSYEKLCLNTLKLQILYPIDRIYLNGPATIEYWHKLALNNHNLPDSQTIINSIVSSSNNLNKDCAHITAAVFKIGHIAGLSSKQISLISRDGGIPFPSGRALHLFKKYDSDIIVKALKNHRKKDLKILNQYNLGTKGIIVFPNGRVRIVDSFGYKLGQWLRNKKSVIPYITSFKMIKLFKNKK